jgi:hypothetical protein
MLTVLVLVGVCLGLEDFSVSGVLSFAEYSIGMNLSISWLLADEVFISVPDYSQSLSFSDAEQFCQSLSIGNEYSGLVSLRSPANIAAFKHLTSKHLTNYWVGLVQDANTYFEPEHGFKWTKPDNSQYDLLGIDIWKRGQPDNLDQSNGNPAHCACYDSREPDGLADCDCARKNTPVCMVVGKYLYNTHHPTNMSLSKQNR